MEIHRKMIDRGMRKNFLALACVMNSHFRRFSKSMKIYGKIDPKSQKRAVGAVRVDLLIIFIDFGPCRKIDVFLCRLGASKN